jgi:hypothetical protein
LNIPPKVVILEEQFEVIDITTKTENEVFIEEPEAQPSEEESNQEMSASQDEESAEQSIYQDSEILEAVEE